MNQPFRGKVVLQQGDIATRKDQKEILRRNHETVTRRFVILPSLTIVRRHQLIPFHALWKLLLQSSRMRPRLQRDLLPNRSSKAARPLLPREVLHHILNCLFVHQIRVATHIICLMVSLYCLPAPFSLAR